MPLFKKLVSTVGFLITLLNFPLSHASSSTPPFRFVPAESYYQTLMDLLNSVCTDDPATHHTPIQILHFNFFTENGQTRQIARKLVDLKARCPELNIRIILEGSKDAGKPSGAATRNRITANWLTAQGIDVHFIAGLQAGAFKGVTHAKAIRVGNKLLSGSTNLTNTSIGKNNEFNLLVESNILTGNFETFAQKLVTASGQLHNMTATDGPITLLTDSLFFENAMSLIQAAGPGDSLDVTTYFFAYRTETDLKAKMLFDAIVAAHGRGADVRIYLERNSNPKVNPSITKANKLVANRFARAGIEKIYFDPEEKISHAKIIKLRGKNRSAVLLGSTNLYRGDLDDNHQVNFLIEGAAPVDQVTAYLNHKFAYEAATYDQTMGGARSRPMVRFWRGYSEGTSLEQLRNKLNSSLIPQTTEVGAGRGLLAYLPAMFASTGGGLPSEVAVIVYENPEMYNAIRTTPQGAKYGPLHFEPGLFVKQTAAGQKSGSLEATPYTGTLATSEAAAYILGPERLDWQSGHVVLRTILRTTTGSPQFYLDALNQTLDPEGLRGSIVLVDPKYLMVMMNFRDKTVAKAFEPDFSVLEAGKLTLHSHISYEKSSAPARNIELNKGLNVEFSTALLPTKDLIRPILESFIPCDDNLH